MPTDASYKDQLFKVLGNRYSNTGPIGPRSLNDVMNDIAAEKEAAASAARPPRTLLGIGEEGGGIAGDVGLTALRGAVGIPQAAVGLANIPTGGRAGRFLEQHGFAPSVAQEELGKLYSPAQKFAQREVDSAKGFLPTLQAYARNPSVAAQRVAESLPAAVAGGVAGRGLLALGKYTPTIARVATPVAGRLGLSAEAAAGAAGESLVGAGQFAEQARAESPDRLITPAQQALAPLAGGLSGLISAGGAGIAPKIGLSDIDTVLAGGARQAAQAGGRAFNAAKGAAVEGIEEMAQSAQEQVLQNISTGKPWHEGIDKAAASGLLLGGATGAAMNYQEATPVAGVDERFAREREAIAEIGRQNLSNQELLQLRESPDALAEIGIRPENIDEVLSNRMAVAQQAEDVVASGIPESSLRGQAARLDLDKAARQEQNVPTGAGRAASAEQGQKAAPVDDLSVASAFADMAATEATPEFSLASEAADQAAGEVNEEAQFETESSASRKRAAGIPLSEQEQIALLAAEQRLTDAAQARAAGQVAAPPMQGAAQVARGIEGESREQVASGYDEYRPQPPGEPIEPLLRRGLPRQYAEVPAESVEPRTFARESEAYRKAANLPTSQSAEYKRIAAIPAELPEELRNPDNMTRVRVRAVIEKMGIPVKKGASLADLKATIKQFAQSYQTRTPDQQAFIDDVDAREAAARPAPKTPAQVEAERAAVEFEDLPLKPAPGGEAHFAGVENIASEQEERKQFASREGEDVAASLPVMMRDLSQGTAGRRLRNAGESYGYDADAGTMIAEPSSYPEWVQEDPELSKAGRATIERVAELGRTGGKMTDRQIDLWARLKVAAQKEYNRNPEIQQGVEFDRLAADGYNFEAAEGGLLASDLAEGDSVALLEDGAIVRYTSQGVDENTGRVVLEKDGGGTKEFSGLDPVEPVAVKIKPSEKVLLAEVQGRVKNVESEPLPPLVSKVLTTERMEKEGRMITEWLKPFTDKKWKPIYVIDNNNFDSEISELPPDLSVALKGIKRKLTTKGVNGFAHNSKIGLVLSSPKVTNDIDGMRSLYILAHEIGHYIKVQHLNAAPESLKREIRSEYLAWKIKNKHKIDKGISIRYDRMPYSRVYGSNIVENMPVGTGKAPSGKPVSEYDSSFDEWFADQVAKVLTSSEKPISQVEIFFKEVGEMLKKLLKEIVGTNFIPAEILRDFVLGGDSFIKKYYADIQSNRNEVPFSKTPALLKDAADVRAELAKKYSAGWIDRAERRGLFKFVDPAAAERLVVEMGIDPKRAADGRIEGFVSPDGQVHFVQGGIEAGQVLGVAAHETGQHVMRSGFAKEQDWLDVLAQSDQLLAKGDKSVTEARRRAVEAGTPDSLLREETVAYLSNIAPKHGIIRNLIAKLKQFMINKGLGSGYFISKLTADDLQSLAQGATKAAIKGKAAPGWAKGVDARLSYAGERAKTADIKRLDEAKAMQAKGIDNEEIRQKTGWFQGLDRKWRFEIDDSEAKFFYPSAEKRSSLSKSEYGVDLVDILDHKSLYAAYPDLMDMQVYFRDGETAYYTDSNRKGEFGYITIPIKFNNKYFNETLIHEIQHAIQSKSLENFSKGGAESSYNKQKEAKIYKGVIFIQDEIEKIYGRVPITREEATEAVNKTISKYKENDEDWILPGKEVFDEYIRNRVFRLRDSLKPEYKEITDLINVYGLNVSTETRSGEEIYRRLAGEIEAEDVSKRLSLSGKDRMTVRPYDLQLAGDGVAPINRDEIILTTNNDPSSISSRITPDLRVEATNKKGEPVTRPLTKKAIAAQKPLAPVKEAVERRVAELRSGLTEGDMLARKIEEEAQKKISPRRQAQAEKDLLEQVRVFRKQHLQPEIQDMANEIFSTIDPAARRITPAKEADLKATRAEIERLKAEGADVDPALEAKVSRLDRRRIGDMLPGEAQALLDVANELAYVNKTKNKLLAVKRGQDAAELSKGIIAPIEAKPSKRYAEAKRTGQKAERGKNPILDLGRQLLGDPASTFKNLMFELGRADEKSSAYRLAQTVAERQNVELKHRKELDEQLARSIGKDWQRLAESKEWNAEQDVNGRKLTSGEKVYLKYSLNDQNVSDSIEKMGYRKKLGTKAAKMSRAEREAIKLTQEEQKVYDSLADYFESTYQVLNPAHVEMKGWTLPAAGRGKYLPKSVSNLTLADELGSIIRSGSIENTGVVQDRIGTLNEINLKDIFEVITRQRDIASKYAAYAPMVRDFNLVFRSPDLKNTLQMEYGVEKNGKSIVENYVDDLLRDLQGNKPQSDSGVEAAVRRVRTNTAGALLAFRLTTPLMQMTGYPRALAHISPQNLAKALRMNGGFEEAAKWNMRAYARRDIGIDREIADNRSKRLIRAGMAGIKKMDELVTGRLWSATKLQTAQETGLRGDELLKETSKRFDAVLDTQGGHTMADLSMTSRTQSELAKMFTIFSSDKFAMLNELKRGLIIKQHTGDWKPLARASAGMVLSAAMAAGVVTAVGGAVSGKDKDYEEEFVKNLTGSLPLFDQLVSMFQGFNPSSAGIEAIGDAAKAAGRIASLAQKQASGETVTAEQYSKALQAVVNSASLAAGVPTKNITDNLGLAKRLALGKDALEQVESELRSLEDFDFEKRKAKITKGKQGAELRAALSKLQAEFAGLDQEKVAAARRLAAAKKRIKEIDNELDGELPAALRSRRERLREEIAARAVR